MTKLLVVSDVHSNFTALEAVLKDAEHYAPYDAQLCAGDIVGYGPQPNEVIETLRRHKFICVMGNHDRVVVTGKNYMDNPFGKKAIELNIKELTQENRDYLSSLPAAPYVDPKRQFAMVHAFFSRDIDSCVGKYVFTADDAMKAMKNLHDTSAILGIIGHTHIPMAVWGWVDCFNGVREVDDERITHLFNGSYIQRHSTGANVQPQHRTMRADFTKLPEQLQDEFTNWQQKIIFNPGSVGQPRNHCPHASYGIVSIDDGTYTLSFKQVAYDVAQTQKLMSKKCFPQRLIDRLADGG